MWGTKRVWLILLLTYTVLSRDLGIGCARWGNEGMYDLMPLAKGYSFSYPSRDNDYYEIPSIALRFNLCKRLSKPCESTFDTPATLGNASNCRNLFQDQDPIYTDSAGTGLKRQS